MKLTAKIMKLTSKIMKSTGKNNEFNRQAILDRNYLYHKARQ